MNTPPSEEKALSRFSGRRFNSYAAYFRRHFGERIQKVAINAGLGCPNRDGTKGVGGCSFCNNAAFTPSYCSRVGDVRRQVEEGIAFHKTRYKAASQYIAYFQSYSNTYAPLPALRELYESALGVEGVVGLIIGTRPDCVDEEKLDYFASLAQRHYISIEYGVESTHDTTLQRINRCDTYERAEWAIGESHRRGLRTGAHFILGLPDESREMMLTTIDRINRLPLTTVKFHQLQIFAETAMAEEWEQHPERFTFWSAEEYIALFIEILERLRPDLVVERFASEAPPRYHHPSAPNWGLIRNETLLNMLDRELTRRATYQGRLYTPERI